MRQRKSATEARKTISQRDKRRRWRRRAIVSRRGKQYARANAVAGGRDGQKLDRVTRGSGYTRAALSARWITHDGPLFSPRVNIRTSTHTNKSRVPLLAKQSSSDYTSQFNINSAIHNLADVLSIFQLSSPASNFAPDWPSSSSTVWPVRLYVRHPSNRKKRLKSERQSANLSNIHV